MWEKFYVGTGLVPVLTLMRTATRAVPTSTTLDSIYHFYELSNSLPVPALKILATLSYGSVNRKRVALRKIILDEHRGSPLQKTGQPQGVAPTEKSGFKK